MSNEGEFFRQGIASAMDAQMLVDQKRTAGLDKAGIVLTRPLDLSTLSVPVSLGVRGTALILKAQGTSPGTRLIVNESFALFPGDRVDFPFDNVMLRRGNPSDGVANSVTTGTALLAIEDGGAKYKELATSPIANGMALLGQLDVAGPLNGTMWWGLDANGNLAQAAAAETDVNTIDVSPYRIIQAIWEGTFANAVTMEFSIARSTRRNATNYGVTYTIGLASGGVLVNQIDTLSPITSGAGDVYLTATKISSPYAAQHIRIRVFMSGASGVVTGGRLSIFGWP
jgi:hypothetical protein